MNEIPDFDEIKRIADLIFKYAFDLPMTQTEVDTFLVCLSKSTDYQAITVNFCNKNWVHYQMIKSCDIPKQQMWQHILSEICADSECEHLEAAGPVIDI